MQKYLLIFFILFLIIALLIYLNKSIIQESFSNKSISKMCIFRILGNNLSSVHSDTQTYDNLKFTLENEIEFKNCDKIWILNRIVNTQVQQKYKNILDKYNKKYLIIPFKKYEYDKIKKRNNIDLDSLSNTRTIFNKLYEHSLYLININGARNYCLKYGRSRYLYSFVLDGSCFFTEEQFNNIIHNINNENDYLIIPLIRLNQNNLNVNLKNLNKEEPQIAFKNTSTLNFDERLPYGLSNKTELLRRLRIRGKWDNWTDNKQILNISDRPKVNAKTQIISSICRLSNGTTNKNKKHIDRSNGLLQLVKNVDNVD